MRTICAINNMKAGMLSSRALFSGSGARFVAGAPPAVGMPKHRYGTSGAVRALALV